MDYGRLKMNNLKDAVKLLDSFDSGCLDYTDPVEAHMVLNEVRDIIQGLIDSEELIRIQEEERKNGQDRNEHLA